LCESKAKIERDVQRKDFDGKTEVIGDIKKGYFGNSRVGKKKGDVGLKQRIPIAKVSGKQQKTNSSLAKIKAKKIVETGATCESCGMSSRWLDLSHFIPRSIRKDLEEHPDGCAIACRGCHDSLESLKGEAISRFLNLDKILAFLLENDIKRYNLVLNAINKAK
jgi:hypothetical protein